MGWSLRYVSSTKVSKPPQNMRLPSKGMIVAIIRHARIGHDLLHP